MDLYIDGDFEIPSQFKSSKNKFYSSIYSSKNQAYVNINPSPAEQLAINNDAFDEVVDFYNKREAIFKKFENSVGINMWFFEHFRLYFLYRTFFLKILCINSFLDENNDGLVVSSDYRVAKFIDAKNIKIIPSSINPNSKKNSKSKELFFMLKCFKWRFKQSSKHLIVSRIEDDINGKDQRFGQLENGSDKILNRDIFNSSKELPINNLQYRPSKNVDTLFIKNLLSINGLISFFKFKKRLDILFKELNTAETTDVKESIINGLFQKSRPSYFVYFLKYKSFAKLFKKTNYCSVLFINENSAQQKAIQYAAIENNVKVFAIQHGAIYDLHPAYMFGQYNTPPLLPTTTFTWGNYFTELLIKNGGYTIDQVKTAGRIVPENVNRKQHEALNSEKKIIVYATQPQPDQILREKELRDVFAAVKNLRSKYFLVIRPHPAEKDDSFFTNIALEINFNDFIIDRISDLKTHFERCALLITSYSTVGAEFIPHFKPLLVLDYLKADTVNYIKQGVGIPIYNGDELLATLTKEKLNIDRNSFELFIENYFYLEGEKAVEIVQNELSKTIQ